MKYDGKQPTAQLFLPRFRRKEMDDYILMKISLVLALEHIRCDMKGQSFLQHDQGFHFQ